MQIAVPNAGKAIIHFTRARAAMLERYATMANCSTCDKQIAQSYKEASEFFETLIIQVQEQTND